ncbi:AlpA family transcriptional regulator [Poseidonocella sp. HB161398]|uniref:helix-turn-helix transcriptional regulator n=1 Tax=Poseidonocella sp. HB161398 TaxID=2320855 RepID=UPI0011082575|nr:hypothetical protein [Poseidonocella sp. HB161398]
MTARTQPLAVREKAAAELLDMPRAEFRRLVNCGALPRPVMPRIGGADRWSVSQLEAVISGSAALPELSQDIEF